MCKYCRDDEIGPAHPEFTRDVSEQVRPYKAAEMRAAEAAAPSFNISELRAEAAVKPRALVLRDAEKAVCSDRNAEYGEPIDNFGRWAGACNALGYQGPGGRALKPHDLAVIMGLGKLSRAMQSPDKADTWVDLAGYAAVAHELVTLEG